MKLKDIDESLEVDIYNDGGQLYVYISNEGLREAVYTVETMEDIKNSLEAYLKAYCNLED